MAVDLYSIVLSRELHASDPRETIVSVWMTEGAWSQQVKYKISASQQVVSPTWVIHKNKSVMSKICLPFYLPSRKN